MYLLAHIPNISKFLLGKLVFPKGDKMCGIFAYQGNQNATQIVFEGLKKLEYRGYDSWGVADLEGSREIDKHVGKIGSAKLKLNSSSNAIGHTRWATHGGVTKLNSHPHLDCSGRVVIIHNGIIENFEPLKKSLLKKGHKFVSGTDTEVFAHLVEENLDKYDFETAVRKSFNKLKGSNTLVAGDTQSGLIVGYRNGSPLIAGIDDDGGLYLSSDIPALLSHTKNMLILNEGEGVIMDGKDLYHTLAIDGKRKLAKTEEIQMDEEVVEKGKYKHFLIKEINDQVEVVKRIAQSDQDQIERVASMIRRAGNTFYIACGTAAFAGAVGSYLLSDIAGVGMSCTIASEFPHFEQLLDGESLVIAGSQSGETMDTLEAVKSAKSKGANVIAMVNVPGSSLTRIADETILLKAGPERSVLSTKAYIAKESVFLLLAHTIAGNSQEGKKILEHASSAISKVLKRKKEIKSLAKKLYKNEHMYLIGRGANYPTVEEGALKIKEASYIHAEGMAGGELKHGTIALIEEGTPCIVVQANDEVKDEILSNAMELKARGALIIGVSPERQAVFDDWIKVEDIGVASPLVNIVPLQLLAYELTLLRGHDPDKPRNLAKSVTVK